MAGPSFANRCGITVNNLRWCQRCRAWYALPFLARRLDAVASRSSRQSMNARSAGSGWRRFE